MAGRNWFTVLLLVLAGPLAHTLVAELWSRVSFPSPQPPFFSDLLAVLLSYGSLWLAYAVAGLLVYAIGGLRGVMALSSSSRTVFLTFLSVLLYCASFGIVQTPRLFGTSMIIAPIIAGSLVGLLAASFRRRDMLPTPENAQ